MFVVVGDDDVIVVGVCDVIGGCSGDRSFSFPSTMHIIGLVGVRLRCFALRERGGGFFTRGE